MTLEEYLETPETVQPTELAFGVMRVAESPIVSHQRLVGRLYLAMVPAAANAGGEVLLAPTDVILDAGRALVVQPDLLFVSAERGGIVGDRIYGAPDAVVEVLSPHPRVGVLQEHIEWFARYGVRECWLANLQRQEYAILRLNERGIVERRLCLGGVTVPSDVLPGVALPSFIG